MDKSRAARIAELNDRARRGIAGCTRVLTAGVSNLNRFTRSAILARVRNFSEFTKDNDPYGEHDFGKVTYEGISVFFKMDYYDKAGFPAAFASHDPADETLTQRVLTIMLCDEY